ncbi:hypothetical protein ACFL1B_01870 [Nanoarchaeota archaeon]
MSEPEKGEPEEGKKKFLPFGIRKFLDLGNIVEIDAPTNLELILNNPNLSYLAGLRTQAMLERIRREAERIGEDDYELVFDKNIEILLLLGKDIRESVSYSPERTLDAQVHWDWHFESKLEAPELNLERDRDVLQAYLPEFVDKSNYVTVSRALINLPTEILWPAAVEMATIIAKQNASTTLNTIKNVRMEILTGIAPEIGPGLSQGYASGSNHNFAYDAGIELPADRFYVIQSFAVDGTLMSYKHTRRAIDKWPDHSFGALAVGLKDRYGVTPPSPEKGRGELTRDEARDWWNIALDIGPENLATASLEEFRSINAAHSMFKERDLSKGVFYIGLQTSRDMLVAADWATKLSAGEVELPKTKLVTGLGD